MRCVDRHDYRRNNVYTRCEQHTLYNASVFQVLFCFLCTNTFNPQNNTTRCVLLPPFTLQMKTLRFRENQLFGPGLSIISYQVAERRLNPSLASEAKVPTTLCTATQSRAYGITQTWVQRIPPSLTNCVTLSRLCNH